MNELSITLLLTLGPLLWMLGGTYWKGWRRYLWPVVAGVTLGTTLSTLWKVLGVAGLLTGVNSLPYGDSVRWPLRLAVFLGVASPGLVLSLKAWPAVLIGWILISLLFLASRKVSWVTHKIFEGGCGFLQAACVVIGTLS